ncbi:Rz1-like lysis system protein LysC [Neisseria leonii]|uniref:Rz1-like lysis system protein LysC n=1 Tax=Neisseria leonii TaxID=2995413 RepID=A0A9X4E0W8_9NEIS|nr:Rz1-like lysis system protein LysC [Neisseria sp. 51.81]MDD9326764.1 Rz1-like lysis system protein LysC [Neisseria sp. 51.81]
MKTGYTAALVAAFFLSACTARHMPQDLCPMPPECRVPEQEILTQGDLAQVFVETRSELLQCKAGRDILVQCLNGLSNRGGWK